MVRPQEKCANLKEVILKLLPAALFVLQNGLCMLILRPALEGSGAGGTEKQSSSPLGEALTHIVHHIFTAALVFFICYY